MSPVPVFILFCIEKTHIHTQKSVGVFTPTSPNLSKHFGFQTIQSRAKETRQTRPGVMLSQQQMSDLKGRRGFEAIYIHGTLRLFEVVFWLHTSIPLDLDGPSYYSFTTFYPHVL